MQYRAEGFSGGVEVLQGLIFLNLVEICPGQVSYHGEGVAAGDDYCRLKFTLQHDHGAILKPDEQSTNFSPSIDRCRAERFPPKTRTVQGCTAFQRLVT